MAEVMLDDEKPEDARDFFQGQQTLFASLTAVRFEDVASAHDLNMLEARLEVAQY